MKLEDLQKNKKVFENGAFVEKADGSHIGVYDAKTQNTTLYIQNNRMPLEANRIFKTKAQMEAYINDQLLSDGTINKDENGNPVSSDDTVKSALPGIILTVIDDDEKDNNGMYYIENADPNNTPGLSASKINITGPIFREQIDVLFDDNLDDPAVDPDYLTGQTGGTEEQEQ